MAKTIVHVEQAEAFGHDRACVIEHEEATLLLLADGAGGMAGGGEAADAFVALMKEHALGKGLARDAMLLEALMRRIDRYIAENKEAGECAAVAIWIEEGQINGVSVGDTKTWIVYDDICFELSAQQRRKPLLGSGQSVPVAFGPFARDGRVVTGSDGLFASIQGAALADLVREHSLDALPASVMAVIHEKSSTLEDDISFVACDCRVDSVA